MGCYLCKKPISEDSVFFCGLTHLRQQLSKEQAEYESNGFSQAKEDRLGKNWNSLDIYNEGEPMGVRLPSARSSYKPGFGPDWD